MLIFKIQTGLNDKLLPVKDKSKKENILIAKIWLSPIFELLNFSLFWEHFVTKAIWQFLSQHKILDFWIPCVKYFKRRKSFYPSVRSFFNFVDTKTDYRKKPLRIKKNAFSNIVFDIFSSFKCSQTCQLLLSLHPTIYTLYGSNPCSFCAGPDAVRISEYYESNADPEPSSSKTVMLYKF